MTKRTATIVAAVLPGALGSVYLVALAAIAEDAEANGGRIVVIVPDRQEFPEKLRAEAESRFSGHGQSGWVGLFGACQWIPLRQIDDEDGPSARCRFVADAAAVPDDDLFDDAQA